MSRVCFLPSKIQTEQEMDLATGHALPQNPPDFFALFFHRNLKPVLLSPGPGCNPEKLNVLCVDPTEKLPFAVIAVFMVFNDPTLADKDDKGP